MTESDSVAQKLLPNGGTENVPSDKQTSDEKRRKLVRYLGICYAGIFFLGAPALFVYLKFFDRIAREPPEVPSDGYFGIGEPSIDDTLILPFKISVGAETLDDLKTRVAVWKPIADVEGEPNGVGASPKLVRLLAENFEQYDWKRHEDSMNTFDHYRTQIEGLQMHFARFRSTIAPPSGARTVPLLLIHGFPGSWWQFRKVAPLLTDPSNSFHFGLKEPIVFDVIMPSLPGFMWSEKPAKYGMILSDVARILKKLLVRLSIDSAFVHGGAGLGSDVASAMAVLYPNVTRGLHLSNPHSSPYCDYHTEVLNGKDADHKRLNLLVESAQSLFEGPPPTANAFATTLHESPMGAAAFLMSYWDEYSNGGSNLTMKPLDQLFIIDDLLTEVHLYWLTDTIPHALRLLDTSWRHPDRCQLLAASVDVTTAIVQTPASPRKTSEKILKQKYRNLNRFTELESGGLFHSLQDSKALAADIFAFVKSELL